MDTLNTSFLPSSARVRTHSVISWVLLIIAALWLSATYITTPLMVKDPGFRDSRQFVMSFSIFFVLIFMFFSLAFRNFSRILYSLGMLLCIAGATVTLFNVIAVLSGIIFHYRTGYNLSEFSQSYDFLSGLVSVVVGCAIIFLGKKYNLPESGTSIVQEVSKSDVSEVQQVVLAPIGRRAGAFIIDVGFLVFVTFVLTFLFGEPVVPKESFYITQWQSSSVSMLLTIVAWTLYFPLLEALFGRTIGKLILGLAVIRDYLADSPLKAGILRHLFDLVELYPFGIIALIFSATRSDKKRIGDIIAGTRVISTW